MFIYKIHFCTKVEPLNHMLLYLEPQEIYRERTFLKKVIIIYVRNIFATIRLLLFSTNINENEVCTKNFDQIFKNINTNSLPLDPRDFEILGWCPVGPVLHHGEKVPL